ncbi:MAG TPA: Minf_1886 family protein [Candidatus Limnocylindria bacterium]|nr:Minf_1886 family protein [Candidatus Limnocylindria bacterium]
MHGINFDEVLEKIVAKDPRYTREAYIFVREALDHTQKIIGKPSRDDVPRHVSGQQLLGGIREYALQQYGPMALTVLNECGIRCCEDFGEIVFNMVENSLLAKTEQDSREDFKGGYDFEEAFRKPFTPSRRSVSIAPIVELKKV